jgi:hypothetical protein
MGKNKHILYIQASGRPGTVGPEGPSARHDPLKGYRVVPRLRLRPSGPARHGLFHFRVVLGLISEGTSPPGLGLGRPGTARWPDITLRS